MTASAIEVEGLTKCFGEVPVVDNLCFAIARGGICGLLGGNGAGKTTTLSMLLGLLLPTSGSVRVLGEDMLRHRYRVLARMNFSSPYVDLPHRLTVAENLGVYARLYGLHDIRARVRRMAETLDFVPQLDRAYGHLSAGQKTRVGLAKALMNEPELLLLDEPTASLDPDTADRIRSHLVDFQRRTGATIVLASHNMPEVERLCSDVILLRRGRLVEHATPDALLARYGRETMEEVFLAVARETEGAA